MKLTQWLPVTLLSALALVLGGCPAPNPDPVTPNASRVASEPAPALEQLVQQYLDGLFAAKPHLASFMGDHRFDGQHADLSPEARQTRIAELRAQRAALQSIDLGKLGEEDRIDADIVRDGIDLELLYLEEIREWEWDPRLHDSLPYYDPREMVAERLSWLVHGEFAPLATRLASLTQQLEGLPRLLQQMQSLLGRPARVYTERAIDDNQGRIDLLEGEVRELIKAATSGGATADAAAAAERARTTALAALRQYQQFLSDTLLPRSDGDWRLGAARYAKKFPLALQTKLTPAEVVPRAQKAFQQSRQELFRVALELHAELLPSEPRPAAPEPLPDSATQRRIIEAVRDALAADHVAAADYVANEWRSLDGLRAFIQQHDLLDVPPASTLRTQEMPAFKRGVIAAEYLAPGMLDRGTEWRATYSVDPIDPRWPPEKVDSYLRANNRYATELRAIHEAYPGHHVQTWYSRRNLSPLRAVLWNASMVEGWAVYGEEVMIRSGWGGAQNRHYRFFTLRGQMVVAANALLDIGLHTGQMSDAEAVRFMVEDGLQEQAMAEKKLLRAKLDSTQLCQYFLGFDEILELERDYRAKLGAAAFKQRTFDEALVGHGSIAVKHLRRLLLGG